ncbi:MAG: immunoglobulin domain-containing protein, partial [Verrucomicrobiales bacterium]|nr:immunoglobulin domain-containing protein [Verrucomicrobiales bacterium]
MSYSFYRGWSFYLMVAAWLAVGPRLAAAQWQDQFAERETITGESGAISGDTSTATVEAGEPRHAGRRGGRSVWVSWVAPTDGVMTLSTTGSGFDTVLAVYHFNPGEGPGLDRLRSDAANDNYREATTSYLQFGALAGVRYEIAVDGFSGAAGLARLEWGFESVDTPPPVDVALPADRALRTGDTLTLSVNVDDDDDDLKVHWFFNDVELADSETTTLVIPDVQAVHAGMYRVRFSIGRVRYFSEPIEIQVNSEGVVTALARNRLEDALNSPLVGVGAGGGGARATAAGLHSLRRQAPIGVTRGYNGSQLFHTIYGTRDAAEPVHCGVAGGSSYWFAYVPPEAGRLSFNTDGSSYDTVLAVYTFEPPLNGYDGLIPVVCDDNGGAPPTSSRVAFEAAGGRTYLVVVDGVGGARGLAQLNYLLETNAIVPPQPPSLISSPSSVTAKVGEAVSLTVSAEGTAPLSYQWQKDGVAVPGAVSSLLSWSAVSAADEGRYSVVVSNSAGVVTSAEAVLTVLVPPSLISSPASVTAKVGEAVSLTVSAEGTAPLSYQWQKDGVAVPGAVSSLLSWSAVSAA